MRAFVVMSFNAKYTPVYSAIQDACRKLGVTSVRSDEIFEAGALISQIFDAISEADCIISEIGSSNPNVYYEVGIAHGLGKPTILLAEEASLPRLPFNIRHNRAVTYRFARPQEMVPALMAQLVSIQRLASGNRAAPTIEAYLESLGAGSGTFDNAPRSSPSTERSPSVPDAAAVPGFSVQSLLRQTEKNFDLIRATLISQEFVPGQGFVLVVGDPFDRRVTLLVDLNGVVRRAGLNG